MAVSIPIVSEFNGKGIKKAVAEFKNLETTGQKAQFALKKAAIPAALALGALAAAAGKSLAAGEAVSTANARIEQINKSMGLFGDDTKKVTDRLVKLAEATAMQTGMDNLSIKATQAKLLTFKNLAKTANQVGGAFDRANKAALDMAAAGFGTAEGNAVQLGKALENPIKGIAALAKSGVTFTDVEKEKIKTLVESGKILQAQEMILKAVETQVGNTATATANDTDKMKEGFAQFQQQLGLALLPVLEAVTPILLQMASWAKDNPEIFVAIGAAIATIAAAIVAVNVATALNPFSLILIGVVALGAALVLAYKKFEPFRTVVNNVFGAIKFWINNVTIPSIKALMTVFKTVFNGIASAWNNTVGKISFEIPKWVPGLGGKGFDMPNIPMLANGGIVNSPTLALIGERGPEAVIPLTGRNAGAGLGGMNITVQAGLVSTPDQIGQLIIDSILRQQRKSGMVFAPA
jgi:prepilin signal peptidase PulO-like enzyme (type II secretory pathway)